MKCLVLLQQLVRSFFVDTHGRAALFWVEMEEEWIKEEVIGRIEEEKRKEKLWSGCKLNK